MNLLKLTAMLGILLSMSLVGFSQDPKSIIQKSEEMRRGVKSSQGEMTMSIIRPTWTREISLKSWSLGDDYAMILVTAPARDQGSANLKRKKEIWSWVPSIERTIKLPPSMMSQSWMGSDFKNEDLVRENSIIEDYNHTLKGSQVLEGRDCYIIEMIPKETAAVVWGKVIIWIDKKDYLQLKAEFYDEDQYLVNTMIASNIQLMGGRVMPAKQEVIPADNKGNKTILTFKNMQFDKPIPETFFSVQNMQKLK